MHTLRCPHCDNEIELLGQKDLTADYALTPNKVVRLVKLQMMPEPVLSFGNRRLWTRQQVENFRAREGEEKLQLILDDTESALAALTAEQRDLFMQALLAKASENEPATK